MSASWQKFYDEKTFQSAADVFIEEQVERRLSERGVPDGFESVVTDETKDETDKKEAGMAAGAAAPLSDLNPQHSADCSADCSAVNQTLCRTTGAKHERMASRFVF